MLHWIEELVKSLMSWLARLESARREILLATTFLIFLLGMGTLGYRLIEGWSLSDGLYMTFITLTTIGFGEVKPLSVYGRFFTILIGLVGIGAVAFIATRIAQLLLSGQRLRQQHIARMIGRLENHYILCGYGRIGIRIAQDLARARMPFVVIENNPDKLQLLEKSSLLYIEGNAEEESSLLNAGLLQAQGIILTLPDDSDNVFVTLTARELNPSLFIMARTDRHQNRRKLIRAGADKVIAPYEIGADRMAQVILRPHVDAFLERAFDTGALDLHMDEIMVQKGSLLDGKSLRSSEFRQRFEAIVVALVRADGSSTFNPDPNVEIRADDVLITFGKPEMISRLRLEGCTAP